MKLSSKTTINELLKTHPFLADFLVAYNPKFALLKNKVALATMGKVASLKRVAGMGEVAIDQLIGDIANEIEKQTGEAVAVETGAGVSKTLDQKKIAALKAIIGDLHGGGDFEALKKRFADLIVDVAPAEIVAMEQELITEGMPAEEVQRLSELHVGVFKEVLDGQDIPEVAPGHPVDTFLKENETFAAAVGDLDLLFQQLQTDSGAEKIGELEAALSGALDTPSKVEIHYQRKENQLFPFLENHGITGPSQVMWGVHDEIRAKLKLARLALDGGEARAIVKEGASFNQAVSDMIFKENHILFPLAIETLEESEWIQIRSGEGDIGYAFDPPSEDWPGADSTPLPGQERAEKDAGVLSLDTGKMTLAQINLMLKHLPVDMTFVDEHDHVQYFSAGKERLFPRSPGIIGRSVQNCHPPKSLGTVDRIVGSFKDGSKDSAEFWITMNERRIYIRYFAVRDDEGVYRGTVEVSQDITDIQAITGERRLLDWDEA